MVSLSGVGRWVLAHVLAACAWDGDVSSIWLVRRHQCLLVSSVCMNTLVLTVLYGYAKRLLPR